MTTKLTRKIGFPKMPTSRTEKDKTDCEMCGKRYKFMFSNARKPASYCSRECELHDKVWA